MERYYPIYLDIAGQNCLVVGGGKVAERKVGGLREAGARVRVVSPDLTPGLRAQSESGEIEALFVPYDAIHLTGVCLVFAATNRREVNAQIIADAQARQIPVNAADAPDAGSFIVPSVVRRGDLCLSISTGGNSPLLSSRLCREFEARFGPEYADYVDLLGRMREIVLNRESDPALRRSALSELVDAEYRLIDLLRSGQSGDAQAAAEALVRAVLDDPGTDRRKPVLE